MQITSGEVVSSYKTGNYHLNEKEPGRYFQGVGKSKIKKMQIGAQSCICSGPGQGSWGVGEGCIMFNEPNFFPEPATLTIHIWPYYLQIKQGKH